MDCEDAKKDDTGSSYAASRRVMSLMTEEIDRLKAELAVLREGNHPDRTTLIRDRVRRIDERQDALEDMRQGLAAAEGSPTDSEND